MNSMTSHGIGRKTCPEKRVHRNLSRESHLTIDGVNENQNGGIK